MRIFLTGATGFVGSAIIPELLNAGHDVIGLARNEASDKALAALGAKPHRGALEDVASLRQGAEQADGVLHTGFIHDFSKYAANCEVDRRAIEALGEVLAGSGRRLVVTAATGYAPGRAVTEDDPAPTPSPQAPRVSEQTAMALQPKGVHVTTVRLPQVHDPLKQGFVSYLIMLARDKGVSAYIDNGDNRWPAAHRSAVARLYRHVIDQGESGMRYNAVGEEGVKMRDIAEAIGRTLGTPVVSIPRGEAASHFGWMATFAGADMPASSVLTQQRLGWKPTGPTLLEDLAQLGQA